MTDVPIGAIIPFIGDPATLSREWRVCDGSKVDDRSSPLHGKALPDLTDGRFLMGVKSRDALGDRGGSNKIDADGSAASISIGGASGSEPRWVQATGGTGAINMSESGHTHSATVQGFSHNHGGDNRPQWCTVLFVCRVR